LPMSMAIEYPVMPSLETFVRAAIVFHVAIPIKRNLLSIETYSKSCIEFEIRGSSKDFWFLFLFLFE